MPGWTADERFAELVARRRSDLLRLAVLMVGQRAAGEDVVQDAVLAVGRSWTRVVARASEAAGYAYLRRAVIRQALNQQRVREHPAEIPEVAVEDPGFLVAEADREFFRLVAALPARQRAVLVLRYYADLDDARIAALLGIDRATVRSNAMRGLQKLREHTSTEEQQ